MTPVERTPNPLPYLPRPTKTYRRDVYPRISPDNPSLNVSGKTLLITGGAGGVGRGVCNAFAQAGISRIVIIGRSIATLLEVKSSLESQHKGLTVTVHAASVTDLVRMQSIVRETGVIDFFISAAAYIHDVAPASQVNLEQLRQCFETNTIGPFSIVSAMLQEREARGWKHELKVIYVSSALSHTHIGRLPGYAASKAAFNHLIQDLSMQWAGRGVSTFSIHPGIFYTNLMKNIFPNDEMIWENVKLPAGFCLWLCSPEAKFLSGKMLWAQWDVDELLEKKELIEKDPTHLEVTLNLPIDC